MSDYNLLPDRPIDADKEESIKFGHKEIAQTIFDLIQKAEPPFTVGLYGRWGVGKTTISGLIEKKAKEAGIKTFFFDVWKYERDSLRRQFLIEIDKKLKLGFNFKEILNQSLTIEDPTRYPPIFDSRLLLNKIGFCFLILLGVGLLIKFLGLANNVPDYGDIFSELLTSIGLSGFLLQAGATAIIRIKATITNTRTDSAEGFEDRFKEVLDKIYPDRLLIIIDNLDRIEDKKMVEVLSDVKTFLSKDADRKDKVAFLIPCDNSALRSQLLNTYGRNFDADEFLRKFFNLTFEIPKFINLDLNEYVQALIKEANVKEFVSDPDLESVIIYAFRDNPREIKQFINSLIATFSLAKKRNLDVVIKNPAFLAKILVIRQKFQPIYKILQEKALRETISFETHIFQHEVIEQVPKEDANLEMRNKFNEFNEQTRAIDLPDVAVFLSLRQSDHERSVPESEKLILALEESRASDAYNLATTIISSGKKGEMDEILADRVMRANTGQTFSNLVVTGISVFSQAKEPMPKFFDEVASNYPDLQGGQAEAIASDVFVNFFYKNVRLARRRALKGVFLGYINRSRDNNQPGHSTEFLVEHLKTLLKNESEFVTPENIEAIRGFIQSHLFWPPFMSLFNTPELKKKYVSDEAKRKFIQYIDVNKNPRNEGEIEAIFSSLSSFTLNHQLKLDALGKINPLLQAEATVKSKDRGNIIIGVEKFFSANTFQNQVDIKNNIDAISAKIATIFDSETDDPLAKKWQKQDDYYSLLKLLLNIDFNGNKPILINKINYLVQNSPLEVLDRKPDFELGQIIALVPAAFVTKGVENPDFFIKKNIYQRLENPYRQKILNRLLEKGSEHLPNVLKSLSFVVDSKADFISRMINKLQEVKVEFLGWLDSLKGLGVGDNSTLNDLFFKQLSVIKQRDTARAEEIKRFAQNNQQLFSAGQLKDLGVEDKVTPNKP